MYPVRGIVVVTQMAVVWSGEGAVTLCGTSNTHCNKCHLSSARADETSSHVILLTPFIKYSPKSVMLSASSPGGCLTSVRSTLLR